MVSKKKRMLSKYSTCFYFRCRAYFVHLPCGPSNNRLTVHVGLVVPPGLSITVGGETRGWTEGEAIVFDDSFEHEVAHQVGWGGIQF